MDILARGKYVIADPEAGKDGILTDSAVYCSEGRVVETGDYEALRAHYPDAIVKGNGKQLLMPGIINGHSHGMGLTRPQQGLSYDFLENTLYDWAVNLPLNPEISAALCTMRHLRGGCTTIHHMNFGETSNILESAVQSIETYRNAGIRCTYSPGVRDINILALDDTEFIKTLPRELQDIARPMVCYDKEAVVNDFFEIFEECYRRYNDDMTRIVFSPSWAHGCTDDFLQRVKDRADGLGKVPVHIHTLQTPIQRSFGLRKYGKSLVAHLDDIGLIDDNVTLGHAVYLSESDIELLAARGVSVTHHPSCNFAMRNGLAPVYYMYKAGVNVALGIDDKGINDDDDGIMELKMIHLLHRVSGFDLINTPALDAYDVLKIGTVNTARVCGFNGETGALKPGMMADAILVDCEEMFETPWISPDADIAEVFIHRATGRHVNTAIVGGRVVMEDRRFPYIDEETVYKEARKEASRGIGSTQRIHAENLQKIKPFYQKWYDGWTDLEYNPFYILNSRT